MIGYYKLLNQKYYVRRRIDRTNGGRRQTEN